MAKRDDIISTPHLQDLLDLLKSLEVFSKIEPNERCDKESGGCSGTLAISRS
jgi:hypothetical protein